MVAVQRLYRAVELTVLRIYAAGIDDELGRSTVYKGAARD